MAWVGSSLTDRWAASMRYRDFRLLWVASTIQSVGFGMERVALGWLVFEMTDSEFMVGVSSAVAMAPFFFLGILSGAIADWADRRVLIRFATLGGVVAAGLMALVLLAGVAQVWHVLLLAVAVGISGAFILTVRQAYTYDIVGPEHSLNGLALGSLAMSLGGVVGSLLGGFLITEAGVGMQYVVVACTYVLSVAVLMATREAGQAAVSERSSVLENLVAYVSLLRVNRTLLTLMLLTGAIEIFGFSHQTLLPVFAKEVLGVDATGLGVMTAVRQVGGVVGVMLLAGLGDFRRKGLLQLGIAVAFGVGLMGFGVASHLLVFLSLLTFVNACAMSVDTLNKTLMQACVPNEQRGRAMGSWVLSIGTGPIGHLGVGAMGGWLGAPNALLVNGSVLMFIGVASIFGLPRIRRIET